MVRYSASNGLGKPAFQRKDNARRLLHEMSESLEIDSGKLARVEGQFITPAGNRVYRVRVGGKIAYVTVTED